MVVSIWMAGAIDEPRHIDGFYYPGGDMDVYMEMSVV